MMKEQLKKGDYVLATKYQDGDPQDQWAIGFYDGITAMHYDQPRFNVVDSDGCSFRGNGFRRVEKITKEQGDYLLRNKDVFDNMGKSIWSLL